MLTRLLVAVYFIETGVILVVGPWTSWWDHNFFAARLSWLPMLMASPIVQVGVALTGLVTLLVGVSDAWRVLWSRLAGGPPIRDRQLPP